MAIDAAKMVMELYEADGEKYFDDPDKGVVLEQPAVGVAAGDDPLFARIKAALGEYYWTPAEALAAAGAAATAQSVISWSMPVPEVARQANGRETQRPARDWAYVRTFGEQLLSRMRRGLVERLGKLGFAATAPQEDPRNTVARREGILALESQAGSVENEFLRKSVQLAIDGTPPELIKDILTTEIAFMEDRHALGQGILNAMATFAPAFGMIGTLMGLVQMLATLEDPSTIGAGMAVALLTTLYGALMANVLFLPAAGKLKVRTTNELLTKEVIIEGILSIQSGDNPRVVEQKLKAFVSPLLREQISAGGA